MDRGAFRATVFFPAIVPIVLGCLFAVPAFAGDNVQVVPLASDGQGNQAWVEIDSTGERMKATPFVGGEGVKKLLQKPDEKGALALPVPRLMRLIERARQAVRGMKRDGAEPAASPHSGAAAASQVKAPATGPGEAARRPTVSLGPPDRTGAAIQPPAALVSAAER